MNKMNSNSEIIAKEVRIALSLECDRTVVHRPRLSGLEANSGGGISESGDGRPE